jgi:hypothetical protein
MRGCGLISTPWCFSSRHDGPSPSTLDPGSILRWRTARLKELYLQFRHPLPLIFGLSRRKFAEINEIGAEPLWKCLKETYLDIYYTLTIHDDLDDYHLNDYDIKAKDNFYIFISGIKFSDGHGQIFENWLSLFPVQSIHKDNILVLGVRCPAVPESNNIESIGKGDRIKGMREF